MPDTIELVKRDNRYKENPLNNNIVLFLGESAVKYPNILMKNAVEVPKVLLSEGINKDTKAQVFINRTSSSTISEERAKELASEIARQITLKGFHNIRCKLNFVHSSPKVLFEGKPVTMVLASHGARAYTSGIDPALNDEPRNLIAHELTHTEQQ